MLRAICGLVIAVMCILSAASGGKAADSAPPPSQPETRPSQAAVLARDSIVQQDIRYTAANEPLQMLDTYSPKGAHAAPIVVYVHGGEWSKGDKSEVSTKPRFFNEHGIVFVSINYRLSPAAVHPAQVNDVAAATRWVVDHAAEIGGDPHKIIVMGHSAGCHLVTLLGLDPRPLATVGLKPSDLRGIVSWSGGAFDLVEKVHQGGTYDRYIRATFPGQERGWQDASPVTHVRDFKPLPPFLIVSAEQDKPDSIQACDRLADLIRQAGGTADRAVLPAKTHFTADFDLGATGDASGTILMTFLQHSLR